MACNIRNIKYRIGLSLRLILMIFLITGCSGGNPSDSHTRESRFYTESLTLKDMSGIQAAFSGQFLYYPVENTKAEPNNQIDIYAADTLSMKEQLFYSIITETKQEIVRMAAAPDHRLAVLLRESNREGNPAVCYDLLSVSPDGQTIFHLPIDGLSSFTLSVFEPAFLSVDSQGEICLAAAKDTKEEILLFDSAGEIKQQIPFKEHILALFPVKTGETYLISTQNTPEHSAISLWQIDKENGTAQKKASDLLSGTGEIHASGWEDNLFFTTDKQIFHYDMQTGQMTEAGNWFNLGIHSDQILLAAGLNDNKIGIVTNTFLPDGENIPCRELTVISQETKEGSRDDQTESPSETVPVVLTYATMNLDSMMSSWIIDYNKAHPNGTIEIREYERDETGFTQMNVDIISGNAPDLLDLSDIDVNLYLAKGVLADLSSYLKNDPALSEDMIFSGALRLYEENGGLYGVTAGVSLETLISLAPGPARQQEWTIARAQELLSSLPMDKELIENLGPVGLLRILVHTDINSYIDWDAGTCRFDSDDFVQILELADSIKTPAVSEQKTEQKLANGTLLFYRAYISDIYDYFSVLSLFQGEEVSFTGYPMTDGGHAVITPYAPTAVLESCDQKELAWEFVRSLLSEEFQSAYMSFQLPTRIDVLQRKMEKYLETAPSAFTQTEPEVLYQAINSGVGTRAFQNEIWNIIEEEAQRFFSGEKTAKEAAKQMQNRLAIYVSEKQN